MPQPMLHPMPHPAAPLAFDPPYYAVIFTACHASAHLIPPHIPSYAATAHDMLRRAAQISGYLGVENASDPATGLSITISYWRDEAAIQAWKDQADHRLAQQYGRDHWYAAFTTHIARVDRAYSFSRPPISAG